MRAAGGKAPKGLYTDLIDITMTEVIRKKCQDWKTGLGNRGPLEVLNDTQLILNDFVHLGSSCYLSEPSDVPI